MACWLQTVTIHRTMATLDGVLATNSDYSPRYGDTRWRAGYRQWLTLTALWRHSMACWLQTVKNTYPLWRHSIACWLQTVNNTHPLWRHSVTCWLQRVKNTYRAMATLDGVLATDSEEHSQRYGDTRWRAGYRQWLTLTALWRNSMACWLQTVTNTHRAMATLDGVLATEQRAYRAMATLDGVVASEENTYRVMATLDGVLATDND